MIPYASRTGTRRNLAALRSRGWRLLLSPEGCLRDEGFPYCLDNGAWTAHQKQQAWDAGRFAAALEGFGARADFVIAPDIVEGGAESLRRSLDWLPRVLDVAGRALVPVQDGMARDELAPHLGPKVGIFVGGSTEWKEATMGQWAALAREHGAWCHVGRVNTVRRIKLCALAGVDSFDGTSATKYAVTLPLLDNARRLMALPMEYDP